MQTSESLAFNYYVLWEMQYENPSLSQITLGAYVLGPEGSSCSVQLEKSRDIPLIKCMHLLKLHIYIHPCVYIHMCLYLLSYFHMCVSLKGYLNIKILLKLKKAKYLIWYSTKHLCGQQPLQQLSNIYCTQQNRTSCHLHC